MKQNGFIQNEYLATRAINFWTKKIISDGYIIMLFFSLSSLLSMCDIFGPFLKRTSVKKTDSMLLIFVSRWTDGLTDRRTDRQTDTPAHRCVRMNLKQDPIIVPLPLKFWWPECHRNLRYMEKERKGKKKEEKNCQSRISRFDIFPIFFFFFYPWLVFNSK